MSEYSTPGLLLFLDVFGIVNEVLRRCITGDTLLDGDSGCQMVEGKERSSRYRGGNVPAAGGMI